ncbi:MAG: hypothetical protein K1X28_01430 [Parachlamydiales bacterium]|nr:hypothetical protein [Parachlamydiales bacterium]
MSIQSTNPKQQPFTYERLTFDDYMRLIACGSRQYCKVMTPKECKAKIKDPILEERCKTVFLQCVAEAERFERWHRMN